jgi:3,5-epimerase/4-reductase
LTLCDFNKDEIDQVNPSHIIATIGRTHGNGINTIDCLEDKDMLKTNIGDNLFSPFRMPIVNDLTCKRNFLTKILSYMKICSIPNSMTYLPELLPIMVDMAIKKKTGTINLTNPRVISQ